MIHTIFSSHLVVISMAAALIGGCGSSKPKVEKPEPVAAPVPTAGPRVEEASGEVREALIALEKVHFALNSTELSAESRDGLAEAAPKLINQGVVLHVDGHTDARGTEEYNAALGDERARAVVSYLTSLGMDPSKLHAHSFGEEKLQAEGTSNSSHAVNRRVEFRVMQDEVQLILGEGTPLDDQGNALN